MARHRKDLGERKHERIEYRRPGFVIPAPDAPWIECFIVDISESGVSSTSARWRCPKCSAWPSRHAVPSSASASGLGAAANWSAPGLSRRSNCGAASKPITIRGFVKEPVGWR